MRAMLKIVKVTISGVRAYVQELRYVISIVSYVAMLTSQTLQTWMRASLGMC